MDSKEKHQHRITRHKRVRSRIVGTKERPRVSVFKSNRNVFVQLIDDVSRKTILSSKIVAVIKNKMKGNKSENATEIGKIIAENAKKSGIKEVVFDRGGYKYHGRIKALADGLRAGGLKM